jgi:hypothetical protein
MSFSPERLDTYEEKCPPSGKDMKNGRNRKRDTSEANV